MNLQYTPQTTTQTTGSFYKTLLALRNTYPPEDDLGIPKEALNNPQPIAVAVR